MCPLIILTGSGRGRHEDGRDDGAASVAGRAPPPLVTFLPPATPPPPTPPYAACRARVLWAAAGGARATRARSPRAASAARGYSSGGATATTSARSRRCPRSRRWPRRSCSSRSSDVTSRRPPTRWTRGCVRGRRRGRSEQKHEGCRAAPPASRSRAAAPQSRGAVWKAPISPYCSLLVVARSGVKAPDLRRRLLCHTFVCVCVCVCEGVCECVVCRCERRGRRARVVGVPANSASC